MRTALLILLLNITYLCNGQNYKCLQSGVKRYFVNAEGYVRGMRIDSVITSGGNTVYYPFHTARGSYLPYGVVLDSNGGSWLGKRVIEDAGGTFLFDNIWNDTTIINTQAHTGDTWVFYNDTTSRYYTATVLSEDTMTVLSSIDSIKKIRINAYNAMGIDISDPVNNFQIILSKNHGFVNIFDLYTFPYHRPDTVYGTGVDYYLDYINGNAGLTTTRPFKGANFVFSLVDMVNPTFQQLYDWNPGVVFEVKECKGYGDGIPHLYYFDSITNKTVHSDHTEYSFTGWTATRHLPKFYTSIPVWYFNLYPYDTATVTGTFSVANSLLIDTVLMPEEAGTFSHLFYYTADTSYCSKANAYALIKSYLEKSYIYRRPFEATQPVYTYKMGIGLTNYNFYIAGGPPVYDDTTLIYYRKSGHQCGYYNTFFPIYDPTGIADIQKFIFSLHPNPVTNILTITASIQIEQVAISNMLGEVVYKNEPAAKEIHINTEHFAPGMYFARINGVEVRKFIKQ